MDAKREASHCDTEGRSCAARLKHAKKELELNKKQLQQSDLEYKKLKKEEEKLQAEATAQQKDLDRVEFSEQRFIELTEQRRSLNGRVRSLEQQISQKKMQLQRLDFNFDSPSPSFDRSLVLLQTIGSYF